jgi:hypothetical protein
MTPKVTAVEALGKDVPELGCQIGSFDPGLIQKWNPLHLANENANSATTWPIVNSTAALYI